MSSNLSFSNGSNGHLHYVAASDSKCHDFASSTDNGEWKEHEISNNFDDTTSPS